MFLKWLLVSALSSLAALVARSSDDATREAARDELVADIIKAVPELKSLATSRQAEAKSHLGDLPLYADLFLPPQKRRITPEELDAARVRVLQQVTHLIDSPLLRGGGLDRKQAAPFVVEAISILSGRGRPLSDEAAEGIAAYCRHGKGGAAGIKETIDALGGSGKDRREEPKGASEKEHVSLVQSAEGKELMAAWNAASNYKARLAVGEAIVAAGAEGARVVIELARSAEADREILTKCLERIGLATKPALLEHLGHPGPGVHIDLSRAFAAWPPAAIDELISEVDRDNERAVITAFYWLEILSNRIPATESMKSFALEALNHSSPRVRLSVLGVITSMLDSVRAGHRKAWLAPPIGQIEQWLQNPDPQIRAAAFRFFSRTDRYHGAYVAAKRAVFDAAEEPEVRYTAARALAANAPDDAALVEIAIEVQGLLPKIEAAFMDGLYGRDLPESFIPILCRWLLSAEDQYMGTNSAAAGLKKFGVKSVAVLLDNVARADWSLVNKSLMVLWDIPGTDSAVPDVLRPRLAELLAGGPRYNLDPTFKTIARTFPKDEAFERLSQFGGHADAAKLGLRPAVEAIGLIRPVDQEATDLIRKTLQGGDSVLRYHAIQAVGNMGADGVPLINSLLDIVETDAKLRDNALYQVSQIRTVASASDFQRLMRLAEEKPFSAYQTEMAAVGRVLVKQPEYFASIRSAWGNRPEMLLRLAVAGIDNFGNVVKLPPDLEETVFPLLVDQYVGRGPMMSQNALISIGKRDQRVIDEARRRVAEEGALAGQALGLIARLRPAEEAEVQLVLQSLQSEDMGFRAIAAAACGYLGPVTVEELPRLMEIAQTPGDWGRENAIWAIGEIAPHTPEITEFLQTTAQGEYQGMQRASERALTRIAERHAQSE